MATVVDLPFHQAHEGSETRRAQATRSECIVLTDVATSLNLRGFQPICWPGLRSRWRDFDEHKEAAWYIRCRTTEQDAR